MATTTKLDEFSAFQILTWALGGIVKLWKHCWDEVIVLR